MRLTLLHTNDIHGREHRIAQIATIVARAKEEATHRVLYLDAGDVEETANRLSSLTKGTAMNRLLSQAGCDVATVGNSCWMRYGPGVIAEHAAAASYPLLLANFGGVAGTVPSVLLDGVGIFGLTAPFEAMAAELDWGFERRDILETARNCARDLRERGAELVILLSHLGLDVPEEPWDDRRIAPHLAGQVDLIVGAHSHDLLPQGEVIDGVLVVQAGSFGDHIGRVEVDGTSFVAGVEPVPDDTPEDPRLAEETARIEQEVEEMLAVELGELAAPLDAQAIAELLRVRFDADVGLFAEGQVIEVVPAGPITRRMLWHASDSPGNPGVATLTGEQLLELRRRAADPAFQADAPRGLRGRTRGALATAGAEPEPGRTYRVAGTDWELGAHGGLVPPEWQLPVAYEFPLIVREAIEEHLLRPPG